MTDGIPWVLRCLDEVRAVLGQLQGHLRAAVATRRWAIPGADAVVREAVAIVVA